MHRLPRSLTQFLVRRGNLLLREVIELEPFQ